MYSNKIKGLFTSLSSRIALSYLIFFFVSIVCIFGSLLYLMNHFLQQKDRDIIEARFQQYQQVYDRDGLGGLDAINKDSTFRQQASHFLICLKDADGKLLFIHFPNELENFIVSNLTAYLQKNASVRNGAWFFIASKDGDEDALEVRGGKLSDGRSLYVGARTDSRDEIIEIIVQIFSLLALLFLVISIFGSFIIAKRGLRSVRNLADTVTRIHNGELSSRVPMHEVRDELYELGSLFNVMIEKLERLMREMRDSLDNVAHDLKTPITRLKVSGELALKSDDSGEIKNALIESIENAEEIQKIIQAVMTVSEINANPARLNREVFDLKAVIEEVIEIYFFVADSKNIQIAFAGPDVSIEGDRVLVKQAIANLLDNALKYSAEGQVVSVELRREGQQWVLRISDQGMGITPEDLPRIWDRLYRGDKSRGEPGLGLGLSLVKAIVEAHNGQVTVESGVGQGSSFSMSLPAI